MNPKTPQNHRSEQFERIYTRLHVQAKRVLRGQQAPGALEASALVHEVYLRLVHYDVATIQDDEHFFAVAATAMRQILIDRARRRRSHKRGGNWCRVPLPEYLLGERAPQREQLVAGDLLARLAAHHPRQARVVELRVFGGMTVPEVADALEVSLSTAEKDWRQARTWMRGEFEHTHAAEPARAA
ncbi:ECF-type sigma factor [Haliangium ochraceum]|uniref:RNA polymerase, sigma-24 subunit, ECF subfamily n=1 Tax=Haliangium ochraceum (strain DSM 14365 / JCM 11303 / SMP-2) TaxID=502025 RepID=D0LML4_HALO1|nr:ECF-type sigma factor [Haliangium ochraceum]ACY18701.1 RNA polymerase, sigma-24 subunit, ECF subfamily [Haliangium ochraceum DSM 14365]